MLDDFRTLSNWRWSVEPGLDEISRGAEVVKLEPRMMRLLCRLAESRGQVVSYQELLDSVWAGVVVGPASVYQGVSALRRILGDSGDTPTYIATVSRKGYRLVAPVDCPRGADAGSVRPTVHDNYPNPPHDAPRRGCNRFGGRRDCCHSLNGVGASSE